MATPKKTIRNRARNIDAAVDRAVRGKKVAKKKVAKKKPVRQNPYPKGSYRAKMWARKQREK